MPHFHMPLQSGNDKQLKAMRRRYSTQFYAERVARIKQIMPHACIGVDVIVGFPDETEQDFLLTRSFLQKLDVSYLHVFTYSERNNTPAADMKARIPLEIRKRRNAQLRELSEKKRTFFYNQFKGTARAVLFENSQDSGLLTGFTDNYIKVNYAGKPCLINEIKPVRLCHIDINGIMHAEKVKAVLSE